MKAYTILVAAALTLTAAQSVSASGVRHFRHLPKEADPETVGKRISEQMLTTSAMDNYKPLGFEEKTGLGYGKLLHYAVVSLWTNAIEFARQTGDKDLEHRLIERFGPFHERGVWSRNASNHVDYNVFGALPLEIYLMNGDETARSIGMHYVESQWSRPDPSNPGRNGNASPEKQLEYYNEGYTPQTRLWIDDMYMINLLQTQAFRVTGDIRYIERSAREMVLYLKELQNPDGLFYHSADVPFVWGRGDGWMAAGMPLILRYLPEDSPYYGPIMEGYLKMMSALRTHQRANGLWGQIVTDPESWDETSCSAMFTFGFVEGVKRGWLPAGEYGPAARKAWITLCGMLDANANIPDVCQGTGARNDRQYYLDRKRILGDPHGQAPMLWICNSLLGDGAVSKPGQEEKLLTFADN